LTTNTRAGLGCVADRNALAYLQRRAESFIDSAPDGRKVFDVLFFRPFDVEQMADFGGIKDHRTLTKLKSCRLKNRTGVKTFGRTAVALITFYLARPTLIWSVGCLILKLFAMLLDAWAVLS
jgi:hypothetical protein